MLLDTSWKCRHTCPVSTLDPWGPSDPLGEALQFLRMNGAYYCRSELTGALGDDPPADARLPVVPRPDPGRDVGRDRADAAARVVPGDLTLVPHGEGHALRSGPGLPRPPCSSSTSRRQRALRDPSPRRRRRAQPLICGAVRFEHPAARKLVQILPEVIHVETSGSPRLDWMQSTLRLMASEAGELRPGSEAVITRLGDVLVIQAIRWWIETDPSAQAGWLGALHDARSGARSPSSTTTRRVRGPSPRSPTRSRCRAPPLPPASRIWSASRRCATWLGGGCTWR